LERKSVRVSNVDVDEDMDSGTGEMALTPGTASPSASPEERKLINGLTSGPIHWFSDWPTGDVPRSGAVAYTIWNREGIFIYVGMAGRGFLGGTEGNGKAGPWGRLSSHASGRRSGNQFCVYVADRLVLPTLHNRISEIADGTLSLDIATRDYIRANLGFRWIAMDSGAAARQVEGRLQRGQAGCGKPLLNPI
jgi:hypothetical protein